MDSNLRWIESLVRDRVPESVTLDYKSRLDLDPPQARKDLAKDLSAFANEVGGAIVIGVPTQQDSRGNPEVPTGALPGTLPVPGLVERVQDLAADLIRPRVPRWSIEPIDIDADRVVYLARIAQSITGPHMVDGRFYHRSGHRSQPMEEHLVRQRYLELLNRRTQVEQFLGSDDLRIFERAQAAALNLRVALVPEMNVRGLVELDTRARQELQIATRSRHPTRITWFGAELGEEGEEQRWRFYDSGAVIGWEEAAPWSTSPDGRVQPKSAQEPMVVPVSEMMLWTGRVIRAARRFYALVGVAPPSLRFSLRWFSDLPNPHIADLYAGPEFFLSDAPRASRIEGKWISAETDFTPDEVDDPFPLLERVLTTLGRHMGVTDAASRLSRAEDGLSVRLRLSRTGVNQVWPPPQ